METQAPRTSADTNTVKDTSDVSRKRATLRPIMDRHGKRIKYVDESMTYEITIQW